MGPLRPGAAGTSALLFLSPGPIPGVGPSLRRAHVHQVVEVGGRRDELGAHKRVLQHLPALLLSQLIRHPEEETALALGAEQLAPAVVREVGNVKLVLLYGKSGSGEVLTCPSRPGHKLTLVHR